MEAEEALDELRSIVSRPIEEVLRSRDLRYAMRFSIVMIVECLADIVQHILTRCYGETPSSYVDTFMKLRDVGLLHDSVVDELISLARLRNLVIHRYWVVDDAKIYRNAREQGIEVVTRAIEVLKRCIDDR